MGPLAPPSPPNFAFLCRSNQLGLALAWGSGREGESNVPELQILASPGADSVRLGLVAAGGPQVEPACDGMVPEPQDHTGGRTRARTPHAFMQGSPGPHTTDDCSHGLSTVIHCHTRMQPSSWSQLHTGTHYHSEHLLMSQHTLSHGHTAADMHCHTQTHRDYPFFFCSLGREGAQEVMVCPSSCLWIRPLHLVQTDVAFNQLVASIRAFNKLYVHRHTHAPHPQVLSCKYRSRHST